MDLALNSDVDTSKNTIFRVLFINEHKGHSTNKTDFYI